jgi:hypothetical protein
LDKVAITTLSIAMISLGVFPALMAPMSEAGVRAVLRLFGGA